MASLPLCVASVGREVVVPLSKVGQDGPALSLNPQFVSMPSSWRHCSQARPSSSAKVGEDSAQIEYQAWLIEGVKEFAKLGLITLASTSLYCSDPALAYRGGGPYGMEVTRGQDLTGKDFSGRTLIKQDFKTSILRQANFHGAKLTGASFFDSDLTGADLTDADLRGADFSLANVQKANLSNANLEGALVTGNTSLKGANITGADFTDVLWRDDQRNYLCKIADGVNTFTGNATRDTLFCE